MNYFQDLIITTLILLLLFFGLYKKNIYLIILSTILILLLLPHIYFYVSIISLILRLRSYDKDVKKEWDQSVIKLMDSTVGTQLINKKNYDFPVIYCINHIIVDRLEYMELSYLENSAIVLRSNLISKIGIDRDDNFIEVNWTGQNYDMFVEKTREKINQGKNIVLFPQGKYSGKGAWNKIDQIQSGAFDLSKKLNVPIVPVVFELYSTNNMIIPYFKPLKIRFLDLLHPNAYEKVEDLKEKYVSVMNETLKYL